MLVYGDRWRTIDPRRALANLSRLFASPAHDQLTKALIEAGQLAQGLADAEFEASGQDDVSDLQAAAMALTVAIARRLLGNPSRDLTAAPLASLRALPLPRSIRCKTPEGYAFYAVYPEAYAAAAAEHRWDARPLVIGLRSIGASLAAVVAAATDGQAFSLRPTGPPFQRRIQASDRLTARLAAHDGPFAIVDEGPGLSGSSFGCVADLLDDLGVTGDRMVFMPSHAGDLGPEASPRHRTRWASACRVVRTLDDLTVRDPLPGWFEAEIGPAEAAEDLSAGAWRRDWPEAVRPPAAPVLERRKLRLRTGTGTYLARFAGLGDHGEAKLERARVLHEAGFAPEPVALRRGFLLERWIDGPTLDVGRDRADRIGQLGDYLGLRARRFPADAEEGADVSALREMALINAAALCGPADADRLEAVLRSLDTARPDLRPVHIDGRLHPWEWRYEAGRLCKLDGLDHSCGHDLVGAQDILWDVAGAVVELELTAAEARRLAGRLAVNVDCVAPMAACYAAFQGGLWSMAAGAGEPHDEAVQRRLALYRRQLHQLAAQKITASS